MLPKTGRNLPNLRTRLTEAEYGERVSAALRSELGAGRHAAKVIMRWTGASDRSARNWINHVGAPRGHHLIGLARESDAVMAALLDMCGRSELGLHADIHAIEVALAKASSAFEILKRQRVALLTKRR